MEEKKPYVIAIIVQVIYAGMFVISKAAFDQGMNTFVFIFYRQAAASLLLLPVAVFLERKNAPPISFKIILKLFLYAFMGNTFSLNLYNLSMKLTSATVASATLNSQPVVTFCLALLLRMEVVRLRSFSGVAKVTGVVLCLAGVLVIALYSGPGISPINHHRVFASHALGTRSRATWIKGTFLMVLANMIWSLWLVKQAAVLKEYPNKMLMTLSQSVFSTVQSFIVAVVAERDFSKWKLHLDISLLAIIYNGFMVNAVSFYLQAWCVEMKGPVFLTSWTPLSLILTIFCSSVLGETVHLGSIVGGILLVGGLYSMLWGKSKENKVLPCKVNTLGIGVQNEQEHQHMEQKKGTEEQQVEQV
ncbi:hypothetical protein SETIT_8G080600v2 [Setaria italica]|uniref:WAT1-related protein n=1 Tax=Setaria italica TaxID=4555 RepID=K3ZLD8_SETIT|nr:hypothetical protein SETIT_8G080600v2 [Setaria italica]RCV37650.1 hypothetical protein SETIT_8G080600v2 [Setaria italica]